MSQLQHPFYADGTTQPNPSIAPLCGFLSGKTHSQVNGFKHITFEDIKRMAKEENLLDLTHHSTKKEAKANCHWFLPSNCSAKTKSAAIAHDHYTALVCDLDGVEYSLANLCMVLSDWGFHRFLVYSTLGHLLDGDTANRWRIVIPLATGMTHAQWGIHQQVLTDLLGGDNCAQRAQQISYLPARYSPHYECQLFDGEPYDHQAETVFAGMVAERQRQLTVEAQAKPAPREAVKLQPGQISPINEFNRQSNIESLMERYGIKRKGKRWCYPGSTGGSPGIVLLDGKYFSHHANDPLSDGYTHDAFDLFCYYEHGNNQDAAIKAAGDMFTTPNGQTITKANQQAYMAAQDESYRAVGAAAAQALWDKSAKTRMMAVPNQQPPSDPGIDNQAESPPPPPLDTDSITDTDTPKYKPGQTRNAMSRNGFVSYVAQFNEAGVEIEWESRLKNLVELMNKHHVLTTIGGKTRVMKITADDDGHNKYEFIAPKEFVQIYGGYFLQTGLTKAKEPTPIFADYATAWLKNPGHRVYGDGVLFEPGKKLLASQFNMWQGFAVEPKENLNLVALAYIYWHINEIICGGNPELIQYFYDWVAYTFQNPDKPAGTALVCRGEKGTGKGIIAQFLLKIWGKHGFTISSSKHLVGNFNAHLADTCFLFADEAFFSADKQGEGRLKALITEPLIPIERKGVDVIQQPNYLKIFMATNSDWAVPASRDERRYCVFDVSAAKKGDTDYFKAIGAAIEDPAVQAAFLHDMLHHDLSQYHSGNIPESKGLQDQRMHSLDSAGKWLLDSLNNGYFEARNEASKPIKIEWNTTIPASDLWNSYIFWCDEARTSEHHRMTQTMLGKYLGDIGFTKKTSNGVKRIFGTLGEAIAKFEAYHKIKFEADF